MKLKIYSFFSSTLICLFNGVYLLFWEMNLYTSIKLSISGLLIGFPLFVLYYLKYGEKLNGIINNAE